MKSKQWFVLGLSGVTNSGKTTVSQMFFKTYPGSKIINMDDYFLPEDHPNHVYVPEVNHFNWELLSALDIPKMISDIKAILSREPEPNDSGLLVVEGFLLFTDPVLVSLCHRHVYVDLPYEECARRRLARAYIPPDPPGYFEKVVWPESRKSLAKARELVPSLIMFDGTKPLIEIYKQICSLLPEQLLGTAQHS